MIPATTEQFIKSVIARHLKENSYRVFLFGSRVSGKYRKHSDIDVGIQATAPIAGHLIQTIKGELEESAIPYKIDVVDFSTVSTTFKHVATRDIKIIR